MARSQFKPPFIFAVAGKNEAVKHFQVDAVVVVVVVAVAVVVVVIAVVAVVVEALESLLFSV